jgi:hypothetical protein
VWINCYSVFVAAMPFGADKESGWGREMGHNAPENFLETKFVVTQLAERGDRASAGPRRAARPRQSPVKGEAL